MLYIITAEKQQRKRTCTSDTQPKANHNCYSSEPKLSNVPRIDSPWFHPFRAVLPQMVYLQWARGYKTAQFNYCFNNHYEVMYALLQDEPSRLAQNAMNLLIAYVLNNICLQTSLNPF